MRTLALSGALIVLCVIALAHPWVGILTWTWVSLMSPHRLTFGFTYNFPVAMIVALAILTGLVLTRDRLKLTMTPVLWCLVAFVAWMCLTSVFAVHFSQIGEMFSKVMKIQFMVFITLLVLHSKRHIELFVWVVVISLGFYGVKGGIYTITGGGGGRVWGPPGSFIAGNNELALALTMTVPLMNYLRLTAKQQWVRWGMLAAMILTAFSILGSQSRGAFLAIIAMALYLWRYSPRKIGFALLTIPIAIGLIAFMPESWMERMRTITDYDEDTSATGRINSWIMAYNLAKARVLGGGFHVISPYLFELYAPDPNSVKAAHSIYFQVLGEHGFIGLALFLSVWILSWTSGMWVRRSTARVPELAWAGTLAAMVQVSLIGYAVGGAFLSLAYFDLPYDMMIIIVLLRLYVQQQLGDRKVRAPRDWAAAPGMQGLAADMPGNPAGATRVDRATSMQQSGQGRTAAAMAPASSGSMPARRGPRRGPGGVDPPARR